MSAVLWLYPGTHTYTLTTAACGIYGAELDVEALQLSGAFLAAVEALPYPVTAENEKDYEKFLGTWGTHYSVKVTMGARISRLLQFDKGEGRLGGVLYLVLPSRLLRPPASAFESQSPVKFLVAGQ